MNDETLRRGLSEAAWGYFFLTFDLTIGAVNLLPRFAGYLVFLLAIRDLSGTRRDLAGLRPMASLLALWEAGQWLASWAGASLEGHIPLLDLVVAAAELYFAFQFLTDLAALAENLQGPEENLAGRLRGLRTANLLLSTACCLVSWVPEVALRDWAMAALLGFSLVGMVVAVILVVTLFQLRARVPDRELPQQNI